jgi:hypothetical protein
VGSRFSVDRPFRTIDPSAHAHVSCRSVHPVRRSHRAAARRAPAWHITATVAESCSCTISCPCNFGGEPNRNPCEGNRLIAIKSDTTRTSISLACRFSSPSRCGRGRRST